MTDLEARVQKLELAIEAIGQQQFGDQPGHPFHGNQYRDSMGAGDDRDKYRDPLKYKGASPPPPPPAPPKEKFERDDWRRPLTEAGVQREVKKGLKDFEAGMSDVKRDMPEVAEIDAAHDIAHNVALTVHPDARREFLRRALV